MDNVVQQSAIKYGGENISFNPIVQNAGSLESFGTDQLAEMKDRLLKEVSKYSVIAVETLYETPDIQEKALERLRIVRNILDEQWHDPKAMVDAEFELLRVHVAIFKEQTIQEWNDKLRLIVPGIVGAYVLSLLILFIYGGDTWNTNTMIPVLGIPLPVLAWAAIGSLAAILYRFYTGPRGFSELEIRWIIARPIIGIIMGSVAYLAILAVSAASMFITGQGDSAVVGDASTRAELLWVIAFLGGFSDRFFESAIELVAGKFASQAGGGGGKPPVEAEGAPRG